MKDAIRLLEAYTRGRFDIWMLAGPANARHRVQILSALQGKRVPQSKAGVNALKDALYSVCGVTGDCEATRASNFVEHCKRMTQRLFIGVFPTGIVYADRTREVNGDYVRLAFLSYRTLELEWEKDVPADLLAEITADAQSIQAKRGQLFQISTSGQTVLLGG